MKTKNVILLSLLLSTATIFGVENKPATKNQSKPGIAKKAKQQSAYEFEEDTKSSKKKKMKESVGEESAMDKQKTKNSKKQTEL